MAGRQGVGPSSAQSALGVASVSKVKKALLPTTLPHLVGKRWTTPCPMLTEKDPDSGGYLGGPQVISVSVLD